MNFQFEFTPQKSASNKAKHGIDFIEAQALWASPPLMLRSSKPGEYRYLRIGKIGDTHWTAVITFRGSAIRIISVRKSNFHETQLYDRTCPS